MLFSNKRSSPLRSYAASKPPRYPIVVSNTLIDFSPSAGVLKLIVMTASTASAKSSWEPVIHNVSVD